MFSIEVSPRYESTDDRRLLDAQLAEQIESPHLGEMGEEVVGAMMALLARDGLSQ